MKTSLLISLLIMTLALVSCGGKDNKSGSSFSSNALSTQNGYLNLQTYALEVGGTSYPPSNAYATVINQAIQTAQMQNIKPVQVGGVWKLRAHITAQLYNGTNVYNGGVYNGSVYGGGTYPGAQTGTLSLSQVVFY